LDKMMLKNRPPYYAVAADVIKVSHDLVFMSFFCVLTRHCLWIVIEGADSGSLAEATARAQKREGGFRHLLADGAVATRPYAEAVRSFGISVMAADPRAPWSTGVETHHRMALKVSKVLLQRRFRAHWAWTSTTKQDFADEVCWILNRRPLTKADITSDGRLGVLTPDHLRYGYARESGSCVEQGFSCDSLGERRLFFMRSFMSVYWPSQR
ncbi:hypothetical protein FOL46_004534, partial [Perkinsus olseni]